MADQKIRRMVIEPAEEGGHMVSHEMAPKPIHSSKMGMGMAYEEPKKHVFSAKEGHDMLVHIANTLHLPEAKEEEEEKD